MDKRRAADVCSRAMIVARAGWGGAVRWRRGVRPGDTGTTVERINAFSDGVFAIAIVLTSSLIGIGTGPSAGR